MTTLVPTRTAEEVLREQLRVSQDRCAALMEQRDESRRLLAEEQADRHKHVTANLEALRAERDRVIETAGLLASQMERERADLHSERDAAIARAEEAERKYDGVRAALRYMNGRCQELFRERDEARDAHGQAERRERKLWIELTYLRERPEGPRRWARAWKAAARERRLDARAFRGHCMRNHPEPPDENGIAGVDMLRARVGWLREVLRDLHDTIANPANGKTGRMALMARIDEVLRRSSDGLPAPQPFSASTRPLPPLPSPSVDGPPAPAPSTPGASSETASGSGEAAKASDGRDRLDNFRRAMAEETMSLSDEEIEAEVREGGEDPNVVAERMRRAVEGALSRARIATLEGELARERDQARWLGDRLLESQAETTEAVTRAEVAERDLAEARRDRDAFERAANAASDMLAGAYSAGVASVREDRQDAEALTESWRGLANQANERAGALEKELAEARRSRDELETDNEAMRSAFTGSDFDLFRVLAERTRNKGWLRRDRDEAIERAEKAESRCRALEEGLRCAIPYIELRTSMQEDDVDPGDEEILREIRSLLSPTPEGATAPTPTAETEE